MMDAFSDDDVEEVVIMACTQIGKTECLNNVVGFFIEHDPSPIMVVQPTIAVGQYWSKKRLSPMLRDTPVLNGLVSENMKAKDSSNTILEKDFPGGDINIAGANSPSSLSSRPRRVVLFDETNKYPSSAASEGDPISLGRERTSNFWNKKIGETSTPGIKDICRIEHAFEQTDKRYYHVFCPQCKDLITLKWGGPKADFGLKWDKSQPGTVYYVCQECGGVIDESDKAAMLAQGEWIATEPFKGKAGFHINKLYSPWVPWPVIVADFLEKKKLPETLKVFINSTLAETWEEQGEKLEEGPLLARREHYGPNVPEGVLLITAGIDVQDDRLEVEVTGWGLDMESWLLDYIIIPGDFDTKQTKADLDQQLARTFETEDGVTLHIVSACIDSGGHRTQAVYDYVKPRERRRIFAIKGISSIGHPVIKRPKARNKKGVTLHMVGADQTKELVYGHLRVVDPGPGYCHFPFEGLQTKHPIDTEYFQGLTAEKCVTEYNKGFPKRVWKKVRKRNEPLDCRVYSYAAFYNLNANMQALVGQRDKQVAELQQLTQEQQKPKTKKPLPKRGGFVTSWKN